MRFIPTKIHAVLDYIVGLALIAAPYVLGFADNGPAMYVPIIVGLVLLVASLMTDYELSLAHVIPVPVHLMVDVAAGAFLAASPWLFGFAHLVWAPHLIVGIFAIVAALTTETVSGRSLINTLGR